MVAIYFTQRQQDTCTFSSLNQAVPKNIHQCHGEILCTARDRNEQVWSFHVPLSQHQVDKFVDIRVTLNTNVLNTDHSEQLQDAVFVISKINFYIDINLVKLVSFCSKFK